MPGKKEFSAEVEEQADRFLHLYGEEAKKFRSLHDKPLSHDDVSRMFLSVAKSLGYKSYREMPQELRSCVASRGARASAERRRAQEQANWGIRLKQLEAEWYELFEKNSEFRHGMTHPESEGDLRH